MALKIVSVVLLLCFSLVQIVKSESADGSDYRIVNYEDLLPSLEQFFDDGVEHFDQILFDSPHHQLIVGKKMSFFAVFAESKCQFRYRNWEQQRQIM